MLGASTVSSQQQACLSIYHVCICISVRILLPAINHCIDCMEGNIILPHYFYGPSGADRTGSFPPEVYRNY